jgi:hypothetical protein
MAIWWYTPGNNKGLNSFYCDDCVYRGCNCNRISVDINSYDPPLDYPYLPTEDDVPFKWIKQDKIWCHVDNKGREYPCVEYSFNENGFDIDNLETNNIKLMG